MTLESVPPSWQAARAVSAFRRLAGRQHLEDAGEIGSRLARGDEAFIERRGLGAERRRDSRIGRGLLRQAQVLQHHGGGEARPVVAVGRSSEERRVGKGCVRTCSYRGWPYT